MTTTPVLKQTLSLIILFALSIPASANVFKDIKGHKGEYHDAQMFSKAFNEGATSANSIALPLANGASLKTLASYQQIAINGAVNGFQFAVNGWEDGTAFDNEINVWKAPGVIANYGNRFEFVVNFPEAPASQVDNIEEKIAKAKKNISKVGKGVVVSFPRTDTGQFSIHAVFNYANKTSTGQLKKHIEQLLLQTGALFNDYLVARVKAEKEFKKAAFKSTPANLEKAEFYEMISQVTGWDLSSFDKPSPDTEHGYGEFIHHERDILYWNYKNSFYLATVGYFDSSLSESARNQISKEWLDWGTNKYKKSGYLIEITPYYLPDWGHYVALSVKYPLDGTLDGKKINKEFFYFMNEFSEDAVKKFKKIHKGYL